MSLDFAEAAEKSKVFAKALGGINPAEIGKAMTGLVTTVGTLGTAFLKLGAQILVNPIFLLVIVIVAIVTAIVLFLKKIGVLTAIMEFLGDVLGSIIQFFKDLADWIGLTDYAGEERAAAETARYEEEKRQKEALLKLQEMIFQNTQSEYDRQIAINDALGISSAELSKQKIQDSIDFQKVLMKELQLQLDGLAIYYEMLYTNDDGSAMSEMLMTGIDNLMLELEGKINTAEQAILTSENQLVVNEINSNKKRVTAATDSYKKRIDAEIKFQKEQAAIVTTGLQAIEAAEKTIRVAQATAQETEEYEVKAQAAAQAVAVTAAIKAQGKAVTITMEEIRDSREIQLAAIRKKYADMEIAAQDAKWLELQRATFTNAGKVYEFEKLQAQVAFDEKTAKLKDDDELYIQLKKELQNTLSKIQLDADIEELSKAKEKADALKKIDEDLATAKKEIRNQEIQSAKGIVTLLSGLAEKNKKVQKAALIANGALSIAEIINNSNVGASKEVATKGVLGLGTSALLYIKMATSIASVVAATAKGLSALGGGSVSAPSNTSGGGGGGGGDTSTTAVAPITGANLFGNANTGSQVNAGGGTGNNITVTAIVSETEITASQSHINNIQQNSVL
jgi:hypothetical protein